jgi:5'-methylthioadenosine phosphorylase
VEGGTVVVVEGPRFSTRAESRWYAASGFDVVNMTQYPEAWLAREQSLCYANVSLVTDYDVGLEGMPDVPPVSADAAFGVFADNLDRLRALLFRAVPKIGPQPDDICASALDSAIVHH